MAISIHGIYENPKKSPWNFEKYQSDLERRMMDRLERDPYVVKWMKRHGITIPWIDGQKHQRRYVPDFLVQKQGARSVSADRPELKETCRGRGQGRPLRATNDRIPNGCSAAALGLIVTPGVVLVYGFEA